MNLVEVVLEVGQRGGHIADHEPEALEGAVALLCGGQQPLGGDAEHVAYHAQHVVAELVADALLDLRRQNFTISFLIHKFSSMECRRCTHQVGQVVLDGVGEVDNVHLVLEDGWVRGEVEELPRALHQRPRRERHVHRGKLV